MNGNSRDNRIENLTLLCPNCHAMTETYREKNKKRYNKKDVDLSNPKLKKIKKQFFCIKCCKEISIGSKHQLCRNCSQKMSRKFDPTKEELEKLIVEKPILEVGRIFSVSDKAIKKRCIKLGIVLPKNMRGYWQKKKTMKIADVKTE